MMKLDSKVWFLLSHKRGCREHCQHTFGHGLVQLLTVLVRKNRTLLRKFCHTVIIYCVHTTCLLGLWLLWLCCGFCCGFVMAFRWLFCAGDTALSTRMIGDALCNISCCSFLLDKFFHQTDTQRKTDTNSKRSYIYIVSKPVVFESTGARFRISCHTDFDFAFYPC